MSGPRQARPALLLIACSSRKAAGVKRGRAWDIYDGRLFQVLKKALRDTAGWQERLHVLIVSARYGVLRADALIDSYEERLTPILARQRGALWAEGLRRTLAGQSYRAVHVNLGRDYLRVLPGLTDLFPGTVIDRAEGGIGARNAQTRRWVLDQIGG
jgi:hypothetical protein